MSGLEDSQPAPILDQSLMGHGFDYLFDPNVSVGEQYRQRQNRIRNAGVNTQTIETIPEDDVRVEEVTETSDKDKDFNVTMNTIDFNVDYFKNKEWAENQRNEQVAAGFARPEPTRVVQPLQPQQVHNHYHQAQLYQQPYPQQTVALTPVHMVPQVTVIQQHTPSTNYAAWEAIRREDDESNNIFLWICVCCAIPALLVLIIALLIIYL